MGPFTNGENPGSTLFVKVKKDLQTNDQASKYLKIGTCPASPKILAYMGKSYISLEISKFSLALQPEALVNTSGRVLFSSPDDTTYHHHNRIFDSLAGAGPSSTSVGLLPGKWLHVAARIADLTPDFQVLLS